MTNPTPAVSQHEDATTRQVVLRVRDVCVDRGSTRILENITLTVRAGAFVGLVGPNGAGKTTLLKTMLGLVTPASGSIEIMGRAPSATDGAPPGVGYVPQRHAIEATFPASVRDIVAMGRMRGLRLFGRTSKADREAVARNLELVGIEELADRPIGELSGGQQRRVMLAQALCASERLLILDEPTIGLDLPAEHEFYALLRRLQSELGLAVIAVSHDLVALAGECDELVCINRQMHIHGQPDDVIHSHAIKEAYSCEFNFLAGEIAHHEGVRPHAHTHGHSHGEHGGEDD